MSGARKLFCLLVAVILILSSCSDAPEEPTVTVSATEEITSAPETTSPPPPVTEEITETVTDEITEEVTTEEPGLEVVPANMVLDVLEILAENYISYVRRTETTLDIDVLGSKTTSSSISELRVSGTDASFTRDSTAVYLSGGELYCNTAAGRSRIGGYDRAAFLEYVTDDELIRSFTNGTVSETERGFLTSFPTLGESGRETVISMLGLPDTYSVDFGETSLEILTDDKANLISTRMSVALSVSLNGSVLMKVGITTLTEQSDLGGEVAIDLPLAEDYKFFTSDKIPGIYLDLVGDIHAFAESFDKFEYSVRDDMDIESDGLRLPLSSKTTYAYSKKIGASIEKTFDIADGTGAHTTLTHYNYRRGFSQIDGGSIFVDSSVNADNYIYTLAHPFSTSYFSLEYCTGMDPSRSDDSILAFTLTEDAAENIAANILIRAGIISSSPELRDTVAYTYVKLGSDGEFSAIGYEFSAIATVGGVDYTLTRKVGLEIISRTDANVKVIYIDVEDEEE